MKEVRNCTTELETLARRAKEANSFYSYTPGNATSELNEYIRNAEQVAETVKRQLVSAKTPQERIDEVNSLLERYKVKISEWLLDYYRNEASCPSVMVAGPANFPTNKKEKQNKRRQSLMESSPEYLVDKIRTIGSNAKTIYSDDDNAVERIKDKIKALEDTDVVSKRINAYYKKHGTLDGCPDIDDEQKARYTSYGKFWGISYNSAEIRRLKERLLQLDPESVKADKVITIKSGNKTATNYDEILKLFDGVLPDKTTFNDEISYYISIPLIFSDGSRNYNECLQFETEESGDTIIQYGNASNNYKSYFVPLTDERKFDLIISKIRGSGNKKVIYHMLKDLKPINEVQKLADDKSGEITINGETVTIERNQEKMRLQIFFTDIPLPETRALLKSNGFKWAPSQKAWQRLLNDNAESALIRLYRAVSD